uniref:Uncharacterized protein n=1 Tax=Opuntia streptacantha TaxID=393608 RepID=A0A7C8YDG7_OPUST
MVLFIVAKLTWISGGRPLNSSGGGGFASFGWFCFGGWGKPSLKAKRNRGVMVVALRAEQWGSSFNGFLQVKEGRGDKMLERGSVKWVWGELLPLLIHSYLGHFEL